MQLEALSYLRIGVAKSAFDDWGGSAGMTAMLKGFGRCQAYESLSFVFRGVPASVANVHMGRWWLVEHAASGPGRRASCGDTDGLQVPDDRRHSEARISSR